MVGWGRARNIEPQRAQRRDGGYLWDLKFLKNFIVELGGGGVPLAGDFLVAEIGTSGLPLTQ